MKRIQIRYIEHKGKERLAVVFKFDQEIIEHVRKIPGARWSQSQKFWHVPPDADLADLGKYRVTGKVRLRKIPIPVKGPGSGNEEALQAMKRWMAQKRYSIRTQELYTKKLWTFFTSIQKDWKEIGTRDIEEYNFDRFIKGGRENASFSSQNIFISALKLFYRAHRSENLVPDDIQRPRPRRKLPQVLSKEEVKNIILATGNVKHRALLMVIYSAGLRIGEALALKISDINSGRGMIEVHSGKGGKDRMVPLSKKALETLRRYVKLYRPKNFLFEGQRTGHAYSDRSAQQVLKRAVRKAGIKKRVTLHTLRHSYATHLMEKGVGLRYIQDILGHRSPKTTMIYTHVSGRKLKDVISPLDDMDL